MKLGLCRYCSDYAELDYGLCARCLDFELDRKRPSGWVESTPKMENFYRKSAANNPALLRCPRCTLIIRKEGECPYCESKKTISCRNCALPVETGHEFCFHCGVRLCP